MRQWRVWLLSAIFVAALGTACLLAFVNRAPPELVFEGKPLSRWLDNGFEDATRAVYETGPAAASVVFAKLKREHPKHGTRAKYKVFHAKVPERLRSVLPNPKPAGFDELRAVQSLLAIGPPVIPILRDSLSDSSFLVRSVSAETLSTFRQRGRKIDVAVPALLRAVNDRNPEVARNAKAAVAGI